MLTGALNQQTISSISRVKPRARRRRIRGTWETAGAVILVQDLCAQSLGLSAANVVVVIIMTHLTSASSQDHV
jgi:hypothetical protein